MRPLIAGRLSEMRNARPTAATASKKFTVVDAAERPSPTGSTSASAVLDVLAFEGLAGSSAALPLALEGLTAALGAISDAPTSQPQTQQRCMRSCTEMIQACNQPPAWDRQYCAVEQQRKRGLGTDVANSTMRAWSMLFVHETLTWNSCLLARFQGANDAGVKRL